MKVLILSTYEHTGGAAIAAERLLQALQRNGVEAKMLCRRNLSWWKGKPQSWTSIIERAVIWAANGFSKRNLWATDTALIGQDITRTKEYQEADVIHLHWINQGFISLDTIEKILNSGKKVVMTMHDMWYCTSICHHSYGCSKYSSGCHDCKMLLKPGQNDLSAKVFEKKCRVFSGKNYSITAVSHWLADKAKESKFLNKEAISVIPNFIDLNSIAILDRKECRRKLGISEDTLVITFCAARIDVPIKGFDILKEALLVFMKKYHETHQNIQLLLIGGIKDAKTLDSIPVPYRHFGMLNDRDVINHIYSASNTVVSTSHFETFGQTLIEAQACGCMPVSFGNSGQRDVIKHKENGYLVEEQTAEAFAEGIHWALTEGQKKDRMLLRKSVEEHFSEEAVTRQFLDLYNR